MSAGNPLARPSIYKAKMVLPVRIELTASPFITLPVSGRPVLRKEGLRARRRGVRALDHPFIISSRPRSRTLRCHPSGLYTFLN